MATVRIDLLANVADATKSIESFAAKSSKTLSSINLKTTISAVRDLGAIAANVASTISNAFAAPIASAIAQEDAVNQLTAALRVNGQATQATIDSLSAFASKIQATTKFSDDAVISNLAYLESLTGLSEQGLKEAQTAAIDLAAALSIDLNTATQLVAKAATGQASALTRYGVQVKKGATDSETFANALKQLNAQFGGAAAAQVQTFSGAVAQTGNAFDDLLEEIGNIIVKNPAVIALVNQVGQAFQTASEFIAQNRDELIQLVGVAVNFLQSFATAIFDNLGLLKTLGTTIAAAFIVFSSGSLVSAVVSTFTILRTQLLGVAGGFTLAKVGATAFKASIIGIKAAATFGLSFLIDILVGQLISAIETGRETFGGLGNFATATFLQISNTIRSIFIPSILGSVQFILDKLAGVAGIFNKDLAASLRGASDRITDSLKRNNDQIQENIKALNTLVATANKAKVEESKVSSGGQQKPKDDTATAKDNQAQAGAAVAAGVFAGLQQGGEKGALAVASSFAGAIGDPATRAFVQAALAAVQFFAQGAEAVRAQLTSVLDSIDQLIVNVVDGATEALLVLLEKADQVIINVVNRIPEIIERATPRLAEAFAKVFTSPSVQVGIARAFIQVAPVAARTFASEFVKAVPGIVQAFFDEIKKGVTGGGGVVSGGGGGGGIGGLFGFASGGEIPNLPQFQNDGGLARVSAGENVIDQSTNNQLKQFLAQQNGGGAQNLTVNLMIGEEQLANAILNLNRQGFRLA